MTLVEHDKLNAEPLSNILTSSYITQVNQIYKRNHGEVPKIDETSHRLSLLLEHDARTLAEKQGCMLRKLANPIQWTVKDIRERFDQKKVVVALECAGNRRSEMNEMQKTEGIEWGAGVIANVEWEGALVRDVLLSIGIPDPFASLTGEDWANELHVQFESCQKCNDSEWYGSSITLKDAMRPDLPVLLAVKHNSELLTAEHGYPLRVVVPGHIGARSVKWLSRIIISTRPSSNYYMEQDYKQLMPSGKQDLERLEEDKAYRAERMKDVEPLMEMGVGGAICVPRDDDTIVRPTVRCSGYAVGDHGWPITHVRLAPVACAPNATMEDIKKIASTNEDLWTEAVLRRDDAAADYKGKQWGWKLWDADVNIPPLVAGQMLAIVMRAESASGAEQPQTSPWNLRGVSTRGWSVVNGLRLT